MNEQSSYTEEFKKYANMYGLKDNPQVNASNEAVKREWYIYSETKKNGLSETNIEKLLDIILNDIQHQYAVKQDMENKAGFLMALWGVLFIGILDPNLLTTTGNNMFTSGQNIGTRIVNGISFWGLLISITIAIAFVSYTLVFSHYGKAEYGTDKDDYFRFCW